MSLNLSSLNLNSFKKNKIKKNFDRWLDAMKLTHFT